MHQFSDNTALRSHFESQLSFMHAFSYKTFDLLRQVSEMNLKLARQEIESTLYASRDIMACSDPMQMVQAAMRQIPPAAERLRGYQQHLLAVLSGGQASLASLANLSGAEARLSAPGRSASAVAGDVLQHAAAGAPMGGAGGSGNVIVSSIGIGNGNGSASAAGETQH